LLRLALWCKICSILEKVHGLMRRMYIVLLQDGILYRHLSGLFDLWYHSILVSLLIFLSGWNICGDRGVLKFPTTTVLGSICVFKSNSACLMKLGTYNLIVISCWFIAPLIVWSDFLYLTNLKLKDSVLEEFSLLFQFWMIALLGRVS
jgi:hypothetical protein